MIEQSNEQIKQMQEIMQSNSITSDTFSKKREEDQEFFWQVMVTMSQTMMRVTQMLMQGAAPGNHPPNQAYTPPNYSFSSSGMGYGFYSPPARSSSSVTSETVSEYNDLSNLWKHESQMWDLIVTVEFNQRSVLTSFNPNIIRLTLQWHIVYFGFFSVVFLFMTVCSSRKRADKTGQRVFDSKTFWSPFIAVNLTRHKLIHCHLFKFNQLCLFHGNTTAFTWRELFQVKHVWYLTN